MIVEINIQNFKSIEEITLNLSSLNLFCGKNTSGKTSVIHALLVVLQSFKETKKLDGDLIKIGDFSEIRNKLTGGDISIKITNSNNKVKQIKYSGENEFSIIGYEHEDMYNTSYYLSSNRLCSVDTFIKSSNMFGNNGENFVNFLLEKQDINMPEEYLETFKINFPDIVLKNTFKSHVQFWFKLITGENVELSQIPYTNQFYVSFGDDAIKKRMINTGTGLSYILPLIAICLSSVINQKNNIVIIENPEIYLHPLAQKNIVNFISFVSKYCQIILETHSDYIIKYFLECQETNKKIFVFTLNDSKTIVRDLDFENLTLDTITYAEVQYLAFQVYTVDFHMLLYSKLHDDFINDPIRNASSKKSLLSFDNYLYTCSQVPIKNRIFQRNTYKTLPTYIRNCISHNEQLDNNGHKYNYTEDELVKSIDFMFSLLKTP